MMTSPIGTSFQQYRNTLGSPNVLILRPTSPTPSLSHSSITLTLSLYSLHFSPFLPTFKFYPLTYLNPKFSILASVLHNLPLYIFCISPYPFIHYNSSFHYQFYLFIFFFFLLSSCVCVCVFFCLFSYYVSFNLDYYYLFFSTQNHVFAIIINQHGGVNCIHYMVGYYFVLISNSFIRREFYIRFVLLLNP